VHGDRGGDEDAQRLTPAVGDADTDPLRERVGGHHGHDRDCLARVGSVESPDVQLAPPGEHAPHAHDEDDARERAHGDAARAVACTLPQ
jgi:hypothetical protein